jgi:hypothetical protein
MNEDKITEPDAQAKRFSVNGGAHAVNGGRIGEPRTARPAA